ncbi:MAG: MOSC domain-containing protein [Methylococcaceae bacterium]|jgi:MOSC domain-containing protein YiiM
MSSTNPKLTLAELMAQFPHPGELVWIGLRPAKSQPMLSVAEVFADKNSGLTGDRYRGRDAKRQVTLLQWEHLAVLTALTGKTLSPELLRRNLVVKGLNLLALKNHYFQIGSAVFKGTGQCHPCSRMEVILGAGGYNAMRGHGGLTAEIVASGDIHIADPVIALPLHPQANDKTLT